jgi:hypothetical protein
MSLTPSPPGKPSKIYFTQETEDAIIEYNENSHNPIKQSKIYETYIHYPLFKLTQNIIHTFRFYDTDVEKLEHLQQEIIIYLLKKLHLFNPSYNVSKKIENTLVKYSIDIPAINFLEYNGNKVKTDKNKLNEYINSLNLDINGECFKELKKIKPPKAYSYFGTTVKRWLILYNKENYNKRTHKESILTISDSILQSYNIENSSQELNNFFNKYIEFCYNNLKILFTEENEQKIADSILHIFSNRHLIDEFNKKAIYIYIREQIPDCHTNNISKVSKKLKKIFKRNYNIYLETGILKFF